MEIGDTYPSWLSDALEPGTFAVIVEEMGPDPLFAEIVDPDPDTMDPEDLFIIREDPWVKRVRVHGAFAPSEGILASVSATRMMPISKSNFTEAYQNSWKIPRDTIDSWIHRRLHGVRPDLH